jgi:hypothetical protein
LLQVKVANSGKEPFASLLARQRLPKDYAIAKCVRACVWAWVPRPQTHMWLLGSYVSLSAFSHLAPATPWLPWVLSWTVSLRTFDLSTFD